MNLADFPYLQNARKAFEYFFKTPGSITTDSTVYEQNGNVLAIKLILPKQNVSALNICNNSSNPVSKAVYAALSEWAASKTEEIAGIALEAARIAEIKAAKELQKDAMAILTVANQ